MFGIEIVEGVAKLKDSPGMNDHLARADHGAHTPEMIERALWEIAAHGGNVSKACRSLEEQGIVNAEGEPIKRSTMQYWKGRSHRNRYSEILRTRVSDLDENLAQQAQAHAWEMGEAQDRALAVTLAGLAGANGVEASTILRNIAQARNIELDQAQKLRGRDPETKKARGLEEIAKELAGVGKNLVVIEHENEDGILDADVVEWPELDSGPDDGAVGDDRGAADLDDAEIVAGA